MVDGGLGKGGGLEDDGAVEGDLVETPLRLFPFFPMESLGAEGFACLGS